MKDMKTAMSAAILCHVSDSRDKASMCDKSQLSQANLVVLFISEDTIEP